MSWFGRVTGIPELQVHVIVWQGLRYTRDTGIFLLSPSVHIDVC